MFTRMRLDGVEIEFLSQSIEIGSLFSAAVSRKTVMICIIKKGSGGGKINKLGLKLIFV